MTRATDRDRRDRELLLGLSTFICTREVIRADFFCREVFWDRLAHQANSVFPDLSSLALKTRMPAQQSSSNPPGVQASNCVEQDRTTSSNTCDAAKS